MSGSRRSLVLRAALVGIVLGWETLCAAPAKPSAGKESPPAEVTLSLQLAPESWTIPKAGQQAEQQAEGVITLRIANGTDKGHWFNMLGAVRFVLKDEKGTPIRARAGRHNAETPEPVRLEAGRARDLGYGVMLKRSPDQGTVTLTISDLCGGFWDYADLAPGSYILEAEYVNLQPRLGGRVHAITNVKGFSTRTPLWVGRLSSGPAKLTLNPEEPPKRAENAGEPPAKGTAK